MSKPDNKTPHKERGTWLSIWLVLIILHGILSVFLIMGLNKQPDTGALPWYISMLFLASVAKIVGAAGIWFWKKWGIYLYSIGVLAAMIVGILMTGTMLIAINDILPLAILGWLLREKWAYFE